MKLLFACEHLVASGGMLRLERMGTALQNAGNECAYLPFDQNRVPEFNSRFPTLGFDEAEATSWDATFVPGAGFSEETIRSLRRLRSERFGTRVQMILNDQHVRPRFLKVNEAFAPHLVIFNSECWPPGSYRDFGAKQFRHVIGAVDVERFRPRERTPTDRFIVGAQISKNPQPLIEAMRALPNNCVLRFFGYDRSNIFPDASRALGDRVEYVGPLSDAALPAYYGEIDVMVSTEERAGWANIIAEAMASGVPVVTTRAGTLSIARHRETAIIVDDSAPNTLASALREIIQDVPLANKMAQNARAGIEAYDWKTYAQRMEGILTGFDGASHYTYAPELNLYGKATLDERTDGLEQLLQRAPELGSILDVGGAEGVLANRFLTLGAKRADVWEFEASRVEIGADRFGTREDFSIQQANLNLDADLKRIEERAPAEGYDLTLYLGVHQHLDPSKRMDTLTCILNVSADWVALRTPAAIASTDRLLPHIEASGFVLEYSAEPKTGSFAGPILVFKRARA